MTQENQQWEIIKKNFSKNILLHEFLYALHTIHTDLRTGKKLNSYFLKRLKNITLYLSFIQQITQERTLGTDEWVSITPIKKRTGSKKTIDYSVENTLMLPFYARRCTPIKIGKPEHLYLSKLLTELLPEDSDYPFLKWYEEKITA